MFSFLHTNRPRAGGQIDNKYNNLYNINYQSPIQMNKIKIKNGKINWVCLVDKCPKNCCGPYKSNNSWESMWGVEEKLISLTPEDTKLMESKGVAKHLVQNNDGISYIQTSKDGSCPYLKDNKCSIYNACRPSSCKSYPFFFSKYNGLYADLSCPGWGKGWTSMKDIKEMIKELIKIYSWQIKKTKENLGL
jgi:Fe-S-cluster containining protein